MQKDSAVWEDHRVIFMRLNEELNALVIDTEYWHSPEFLRGYTNLAKYNKNDQIIESIAPILNLLDRYKLSATFAVLGTVAQDHPELVKQIYDRGHEIASHSWSHKTLYELGKDNFRDEIKRSVGLLRSITGESPTGFRAPSFSINESTKWAFEILSESGFKYDASIFPIKTVLYGVPDAPLQIYRPSREDIIKNDPNGKIIEFPMTIIKIGKKIPISGGFYLRALPLWFLKYGIKKVNETRPAIIYIHPWETYDETPKLEIDLFRKFVTYYGISSSFNKLEDLIKSFKFGPVRDVLSEF